MKTAKSTAIAALVLCAVALPGAPPQSQLPTPTTAAPVHAGIAQLVQSG